MQTYPFHVQNLYKCKFANKGTAEIKHVEIKYECPLRQFVYTGWFLFCDYERIALRWKS